MLSKVSFNFHWFFSCSERNEEISKCNRPNTYESTKVARNKAAQGKLNVQKYDKAWKHTNYLHCKILL